MLAFLPIIGPIIQGIVSIFSKWQDTKLGTLTVTRNDDVEEAKVSAQIIQTTQDDIGLRLMRDMMIFPIVVWTMLLCYDTIIAETTWFDGQHWMWHLASFEKTGAPYLPYAVIVFLLGNIGINMWNRK
jgi:hypothetical protein